MMLNNNNANNNLDEQEVRTKSFNELFRSSINAVKNLLIELSSDEELPGASFRLVARMDENFDLRYDLVFADHQASGRQSLDIGDYILKDVFENIEKALIESKRFVCLRQTGLPETIMSLDIVPII